MDGVNKLWIKSYEHEFEIIRTWIVNHTLNQYSCLRKTKKKASNHK